MDFKKISATEMIKQVSVEQKFDMTEVEKDVATLNARIADLVAKRDEFQAMLDQFRTAEIDAAYKVVEEKPEEQE
jgi:outer membrane murein-binding lipoprotein Lpp